MTPAHTPASCIDLGGHVESESVGGLLEERSAVLVEVVLDFPLRPGWPWPPRCLRAAFDVNAAALIRVSVVLPQDVVTGAEVVVDDVEDDRQPGPVSSVDEMLGLGGS